MVVLSKSGHLAINYSHKVYMHREVPLVSAVTQHTKHGMDTRLTQLLRSAHLHRFPMCTTVQLVVSCKLCPGIESECSE